MSILLQRLSSWRLPALLAALCVALGALVAWQLQRPMVMPVPVTATAGSDDEAGDEATAAADEEPADAGDVFALTDAEAFAAVVERPVFHRSRRPVPVAASGESGAAASGSPVPFQLSGVLVAGRTRVALLRFPASARIVRAEEGETIDGWRIEAIRPQSVVVRSGENREEMTLADRLAPSPVHSPQAGRKQSPSFDRGKPVQRSGTTTGRRGDGDAPEE